MRDDLETLCDRLESIVAIVAENDKSDDPLVSELLVSAEELNVAVEEMRVQALELANTKHHLELEKKRYYELFASAPCGYVVTDTNGRILQANYAAGELFGVREDKLSGKPISLFMDRASRMSFFDNLETLMSGFNQRLDDIELKIIPRERPAIYTSVAVSPIIRAGNEPTELLWLFRDVSARKEVEIELAKSMSSLSRSNAELEQFAYIAAHDLKEPLRIISTYSQMLTRDEKSDFSEDGEYYLSTISESVGKMLSLVDDLLLYSTATSDEIPIETVELKVAVDEAVQLHVHSAKELNAKIVVEECPKVLVPKIYFVQVMRNLLNNALKFCSNKKPSIKIGFEEGRDGWICSVADNGIGIEKEYSVRIFQMFQRLHSESEFPGNGIGLAVCKKIIEKWGGKIWFESVPGKGTKFFFTLPV